MEYKNTSNPIFQSKVFDVTGVYAERMTIDGVVRNSAILLVLLIGAAAYSWTRPYVSVNEIGAKTAMFSIAAFVVYLVTIFKQSIAKYTVPVYAILEGLVIGSVSMLFEKKYPGIVIQASVGTFGVLGAMLLLYRSGLIKVNEKFASVLFLATLGVGFIYLASWVMSLFGGSGFAFITSSSNVGIGFSVVVCIIAALNFMLDFEFIVQRARLGADKNMEWIASLGLLVTLIWVYLEILRLLAKLRDRE